jgi:hypothetical protein
MLMLSSFIMLNNDFLTDIIVNVEARQGMNATGYVFAPDESGLEVNKSYGSPIDRALAHSLAIYRLAIHCLAILVIRYFSTKNDL